MRRFQFNRIEDASGVSGTGMVAGGVMFDNGLVALSWNSVHKCINMYTSLAEMMAVHGHEGKTKLVWIDEDPHSKHSDTLTLVEDPPKRKKAAKAK